MSQDQQDIWNDPQLLRQKRKIAILSLAVVLLLVVILTIIIGRPLLQAMKDQTTFREWMQSRGFLKYPLMVGIMTLQVLIAFIPGEPIEIAAGYIFGAWTGMALCLIGCAVGSIIIFMLVRRYGMRFVSLFITQEKLENMKFFNDPKKRDSAIFFLFLIPGTPKDILTYLAALTPVNLGKYLLLTSIARIPSVLSSTLGGSMIGAQEYRLAIIVFGVTLALTLAGYLLYQNIQKLKPQETIKQPVSDKLEEALDAGLVLSAVTETQQAAEDAPVTDQNAEDTPDVQP